MTQIGTWPDGTPMYAPSREPAPAQPTPEPTPYSETRNPVTGKVTSSGTNPYKQRFTQYGNRGMGVKQAARDRKRLMEIRKAANPQDVETTTSNDPAVVKAQAEKFDKLRKEGKNPGYNLGLSENEIAYNKSVRNSIQAIKDRVGKIRETLQDSESARQRAMLKNRIGQMNFRRQNFKRQLFAPTGENAPTLPQYERLNLKEGQVPVPTGRFNPRPVPPRQGQRPRPQGPATGGVAPRPNRPRRGRGPTGGVAP